eukprot:scaffold1467_cov264-Pinguiococcus_pyrenoidosus.AAC.28
MTRAPHPDGKSPQDDESSPPEDKVSDTGDLNGRAGAAAERDDERLVRNENRCSYTRVDEERAIHFLSALLCGLVGHGGESDSLFFCMLLTRPLSLPYRRQGKAEA